MRPNEYLLMHIQSWAGIVVEPYMHATISSVRFGSAESGSTADSAAPNLTVRRL